MSSLEAPAGPTFIILIQVTVTNSPGYVVFCRPEDTDVDRWSLRQAVILIAATNRPDELDERLMVPGRIDREIHIGLPGEAERIQIFGVHSEGKKLAKDVDFSKVFHPYLLLDVAWKYVWQGVCTSGTNPAATCPCFLNADCVPNHWIFRSGYQEFC